MRRQNLVNGVNESEGLLCWAKVMEVVDAVLGGDAGRLCAGREPESVARGHGKMIGDHAPGLGVELYALVYLVALADIRIRGGEPVGLVCLQTDRDIPRRVLEIAVYDKELAVLHVLPLREALHLLPGELARDVHLLPGPGDRGRAL